MYLCLFLLEYIKIYSTIINDLSISKPVNVLGFFMPHQQRVSWGKIFKADLCGATLRQKQLIKLVIPINHSILTLGQPVQALTR